jgi:hypothetical protein
VAREDNRYVRLSQKLRRAGYSKMMPKAVEHLLGLVRRYRKDLLVERKPPSVAAPTTDGKVVPFRSRPGRTDDVPDLK